MHHLLNKRNEYLCLISTEVSLSEEEIIRIYGKRWDIEVFFKVCKRSQIHLYFVSFVFYV